jgi:hypothetical protein
MLLEGRYRSRSVPSRTIFNARTNGSGAGRRGPRTGRATRFQHLPRSAGGVGSTPSGRASGGAACSSCCSQRALQISAERESSTRGPMTSTRVPAPALAISIATIASIQGNGIFALCGPDGIESVAIVRNAHSSIMSLGHDHEAVAAPAAQVVDARLKAEPTTPRDLPNEMELALRHPSQGLATRRTEVERWWRGLFGQVHDTARSHRERMAPVGNTVTNVGRV